MFGHKPCEAFISYTSKEFVSRFMPLVKADVEKTPMYVYHVALLVRSQIKYLYICLKFMLPQRKYCRLDDPASKANTFKRFSQWLKEQYTSGLPSQDVFESVLGEEEIVATGTTLYSSPVNSPNLPQDSAFS